MKPSAVKSSLQELARMQYPREMVQGCVIDLLRRMSDADTATLLWWDSQGQLRDVYSNHLCPRDKAELFTTRYLNRREAEVYRPHWQFMHSAARHDLPHAQRPDFRDTEFYQEFAGPLGFDTIARYALRDHTRPLAALWLTRPREAHSPFPRRQLEQVRDCLPLVEHILACTQAAPLCDANTDELGWLVARADGSIVHLSAPAEAMLHALADVPRDSQTLTDASYRWARPILQDLARQLDQMESRRDAHHAPTLACSRRSGRYMLRAQRLHDMQGGGERLLGVQISRQIPQSLQLLAAPQVQQLPARERQAALLLAQGRNTTEIAHLMDISPAGAIEHLRSLYRRLNIHRREELVPALLARENNWLPSTGAASQSLPPAGEGLGSASTTPSR